MLVTDHSRSMLAEDVDPTRLAAAKRAAHTFLDQLPHGVRVGVTTFSDVPDGTQAPTRDHALVRRMIDAQIADGGTATGDALQVALDTLEREPKGTDGRRPPSAIVLLSDGTTTTGRDPVGVAETARSLRSRSTPSRSARATRPCRTPASARRCCRSRPTRRRCERIAETSGGRAFSAAGRPAAVLDLQDARLAARHARRPARGHRRASRSAGSSCCSARPPPRRGGRGGCRSPQVTTAQGSTRELTIRPAAL